jgi:hypothetical protein
MTDHATSAQVQDRLDHFNDTGWRVTPRDEYEQGWYIVVERQTYSQVDLDPYVVGPYSQDEAREQYGSDEETTILFMLMTVDAKQEHYVAYDAYVTSEPPEGFQIIPPEAGERGFPGSVERPRETK